MSLRSQATLRAFVDECEKIAASLSADQMKRIAEKAAKRGWSHAREAKSFKRLLSRDSRPAAAAAAKSQKTVAGRVRTGSTPPPKQPKVDDTYVRPDAKKSPKLRRLLGGAALSAAGVAGYGAGHRPGEVQYQY